MSNENIPAAPMEGVFATPHADLNDLLSETYWMGRAPCMDTALTWLLGVRADWMRSEYLNRIKTDSVFAPLWARPAFQSLFRP